MKSAHVLMAPSTPKLVTGESIAQAYQFVATGNAELGFVALSQVFEGGTGKSGDRPGWCRPALYGPIRQDAVLLKAGRNNPAAAALLAYLKSDAAKVIIRAFGYGCRIAAMLDSADVERDPPDRRTGRRRDTLLLLLVGTPLAWWLARTRSRFKPLWRWPLVAMPLVLPPTVLGFYLLLLMGPHGPVGQLTQALGLGGCRSPLPAWWWPRCCIRCPSSCSPCSRPSRPSAERTLEAAATLRAVPWTASSASRCRWRGPGF